MKNHQPPKLARKLFEWYSGYAHVDDLLGDMDEWFHKTVETKSVFKAKLLYWKQVLQLLFSYALRKRKKQSQHGPFATSSWSLAIIKNYFVVASRGLYRQKYFTIVNVAGLAVGMSVSLLLITMIAFVSTYDNFHADKDRIYRVIASYSKGEREFNMASAPAALANRLEADIPEIERITRISSNYYGEVLSKSENVTLRGYYADPEFLNIFSFDLVEGDKLTALQKPRSLILTQSTVKKIFGDEPALGKSLEISEQGSYEITGIMKDPPLNTHLVFESLVSSATLPTDSQTDIIKYNDVFSYGLEFVYFVLREGSETDKIESYLNQVAAEVSKTSDAYITYHLQSLNSITPGPDLSTMTGGLGPQWDLTGFYIFGTICLLILLPACFNYTNISIARAIKRAKEIGLRKTMGGQRDQIFFQFITETVVVTTISLIGALLLFFVVRKEFQSMMVAASSLDLSLTWTIVGLFLLFAIVTGIIAGVAPAFFFARLNPIQALKSQSSSKIFSGMWVRKGLTVFQFMLSFGFIVAIIVFSRQYQYSMNYDFGFDRENMLDVQLQNVEPGLFESEYSKISSIQSISYSSGVLGLRHSDGDAWMQPEGLQDSVKVNQMFVDNHYIANLNLEFLAGKNFPSVAWTHEQYLIVNEQFLKSTNLGSATEAIGKVVRVDNQDLEIIGVLKDFHFSSLRTPIKSFAFRTNPRFYSYANLKVSFTDAFAGISEMESLWKKIGHGTAFRADFMKDEINSAYQFYNTLMKIIAFLGLLAISISLLGMLGMVVYTSETRTKEVGIRKVLGASVAGITLLLSKDYLKLMGWAFVLAIPITVLIIDKMLSEMQYYSVRLTAWDVLGGMFILMALGLLTISTQTVKTASTNPAETLKSE
jgi:putative ABC transport system permease protein